MDSPRIFFDLLLCSEYSLLGITNKQTTQKKKIHPTNETIRSWSALCQFCKVKYEKSDEVNSDARR